MKEQQKFNYRRLTIYVVINGKNQLNIMSTNKGKRGLFYEKSLANKFINTMNWLVARPYVQGHSIRKK